MTDDLVCGFCGYDGARYSLRSDAISSLVIPPMVLAAGIEDLPEAVLNERPEPSTWSIAEYIDHVGEVYAVHNAALTQAKADGTNSPEWPDVSPLSDAPAVHSDGHVETTLAAVARHADEMKALASTVTDEEWQEELGRHVRNVVHEGFHHLADIGDIRSMLGHGPSAGPEAAVGRVSRLSASDGGVPKRSIDHAIISSAGVEGDSQNNRKHHGRPCQAICLYSEDVMSALRAEGHSIEAGNAGENITVEGVDWASLRPGSRIEVGSVPMLISAHAIPCAKNKSWFVDGHFNRMLHDEHPGWSRLYAIPLGAGTVVPGDPVTPLGSALPL